MRDQGERRSVEYRANGDSRMNAQVGLGGRSVLALHIRLTAEILHWHQSRYARRITHQRQLLPIDARAVLSTRYGSSYLADISRCRERERLLEKGQHHKNRTNFNASCPVARHRAGTSSSADRGIVRKQLVSVYYESKRARKTTARARRSQRSSRAHIARSADLGHRPTATTCIRTRPASVHFFILRTTKPTTRMSKRTQGINCARCFRGKQSKGIAPSRNSSRAERRASTYGTNMSRRPT
jgi:hypothetical protein